MRSTQKTLALWLFLVVIAVFIFHAFESRQTKNIRDFNFAKFHDALRSGEIKSVSFRQESGEIIGQIKEDYADKFGGTEFVIYGNTGDKGYELVTSYGIIPNYESSDKNSFLQQVFISWLPLILIVAMFLFIMRQVQVGGGKAMSFGKSKAKLLSENKKKVTFKDVAGIEEAKDELTEIVSFLKDPKKFTRLGGRIPKGVLLVGSPGTGKTLLARAIAGEAGVPFFSISGSDFVEMFVGVGASRVRDLFEQGKKNAPCIIFIDEIDAVGRHRGAGMGGGHDEREQTLNQLLVEMDGFEGNEGVILIAATNRPDVLDPALLRPGRFDRRVVVNKPDLRGREQILVVHTKKVPLSKDVDLAKIARGTPGFSGADLENLVNEAALLAARVDKKCVNNSEFEKAKDKVLMGSERRSMVISEKDKKITAYHEAGHTLVGKKLPLIDPVHKVTIIPRGMALGLTQTLPEEDAVNLSKNKAVQMIGFLFGGRAAEEIVFKDYTTGAANDIERATELARRMVCEWGMSEKLGPLQYEKREGPVFLGMQQRQSKDYSDSKAKEIDDEIFKFVNQGHQEAVELIEKNIDVLHNLSEALLEYETIESDEIDLLIEGGSLDDLKNLRQKKDEEVFHHAACEAEESKKEAQKEEQEKRKNKKDPMGDPGPVVV